MAIGSMKKRFILSLFLLAFSASLFVITTISWITQLLQDSAEYEVGQIDVELIAYFVDENGDPIVDLSGNLISAGEYVVDDVANITKPGVYAINIVNSSQAAYFQNFRVRVLVHSSVDTYFRIAIYEQLTWKYQNAEGDWTEVAVLNENVMPFAFDDGIWFDDRVYLDTQPPRELTYYLYHMSKVKREEITFEPTEIELILGATESYTDYNVGYSLQISFEIDAVQAISGPQNVWNLPTPPWGGTW